MRAFVIVLSVMLTGSMGASPAVATAGLQPDRDDVRVVTNVETGATLTIEHEGDCDLLTVTVDYPRETATGQTEEVGYSVDSKCRVTKITGLASAGSDVSPMSIPPDPACIYSNYIHSSQTMQDVINIDIAKHRLHSLRCWDRTTTWFGQDVWSEATTSVSWNHPVANVIEYIGGEGSASYAQSHGDYHSDWLWCNLTASWQTIRLTNRNTTYRDGTYAASFTQSRACPGTHMATAKKTSTSRTW